MRRNPELRLPTRTSKHAVSSKNDCQPCTDLPDRPTCLSNTCRNSLGRALTRKTTPSPVFVASLSSHTTHKPFFTWVQVTLPAGVLPGHVVNLAGKGTEHPNRLPGSVQVVAVQIAHPRFERLGGTRTPCDTEQNSLMQRSCADDCAPPCDRLPQLDCCSFKRIGV